MDITNFTCQHATTLLAKTILLSLPITRKREPKIAERNIGAYHTCLEKNTRMKTIPSLTLYYSPVVSKVIFKVMKDGIFFFYHLRFS